MSIRAVRQVCPNVFTAMATSKWTSARSSWSYASPAWRETLCRSLSSSLWLRHADQISSGIARRNLHGQWTAEEHALIDSVEAELKGLPLVKELLSHHTRGAIAEGSCSPSSSSKAAFAIFRPYLNYPHEKLAHHMTAGQLRGPGRLAVPPLALIRTNDEAGETSQSDTLTPQRRGDAFVFFHLGRSLCGHEGIIHGGLLATLCDEALAMTGFRRFEKRVGVTVRLEVDYKSPAFPDRFVVMQTRLIEVESNARKATVAGRMWDVTSGKTIVEARGIYVEPRDEKLGASLAGSANASSSS